MGRLPELAHTVHMAYVQRLSDLTPFQLTFFDNVTTILILTILSVTV